MKKFFLCSLLSLASVSAKAQWTAYGSIDLSKLPSSTSLAKVLEKIPLYEIHDGEEIFCTYQSKISTVSLKQKKMKLKIDFSSFGDDELCEDGHYGAKELWKELKKIPHLKLSELVKDEE